MSALLDEILALHEKDDFFGIIRKLEAQSELDYALTLQLARAYLNAAAKAQDGYNLLEKAHLVLDTFAIEGKDDPYWLFYKALALYRQGLIHDCMVRLERAARFVPLGDNLFMQIENMHEICKAALIESEFKGLDGDNRAILLEHIRAHFGEPHKLMSSFKVDVLHIDPTDAHPFNLLVTCGLAGKKLSVPKGYDEKSNSRLELMLALPKSYVFTKDKDKDWPVYLLLSLIEHVITTQDFIGFGYYIDNGSPFSQATQYEGIMLTALGEFDGVSQSAVLNDNTVTHFFQPVPLMPMELKFRKTHTAQELLEEFKQKKAILTPLFDGRPDVCAQVSSVGV